MMCLGGLVTAVLINGISNFPPIYPLAMLGGCIWCIGQFDIQLQFTNFENIMKQ